MSTLLQKQIAKVLWLLAALLLTTAQVQAETYYFHNDQLGTPQVVTDTTQQVVWKGEYDPFGECTEVVNLIEQNLRFPGQYFDQETRLHYNYFRTYDPSIGRYVESDPIGFLGGLSTYGYVKGSPLMYTDSYGLFSMDPVYGFIYNATGGYVPPQPVVNAVAGFGDGLSLGLTDWVRDRMGTNDQVEKCTAAYGSSFNAGYVFGFATGGVGLARSAGYGAKLSATSYGAVGGGLLGGGGYAYGAANGNYSWNTPRFVGNIVAGAAAGAAFGTAGELAGGGLSFGANIWRANSFSFNWGANQSFRQ